MIECVLLTKDNYMKYLKEETDFYTEFDYTTLVEQEDYECDFYARALLNEEITGVKAVELLDSSAKQESTFSGLKVKVGDITDYEYLFFNGKNVPDKGRPTICIYNDKGEILWEYSVEHQNEDKEWHQYLIDIKDLEGEVTILFNGGNIDGNNSDSADAECHFNNLMLY